MRGLSILAASLAIVAGLVAAAAWPHTAHWWKYERDIAPGHHVVVDGIGCEWVYRSNDRSAPGRPRLKDGRQVCREVGA